VLATVNVCWLTLTAKLYASSGCVKADGEAHVGVPSFRGGGYPLGRRGRSGCRRRLQIEPSLPPPAADTNLTRSLRPAWMRASRHDPDY
jgi:hypothetical protein